VQFTHLAAASNAKYAGEYCGSFVGFPFTHSIAGLVAADGQLQFPCPVLKQEQTQKALSADKHLQQLHSAR